MKGGTHPCVPLTDNSKPYERILLPMIDILPPESVNPLAKAIHDAEKLEERPDLILRLVDLIFLFDDTERTAS